MKEVSSSLNPFAASYVPLFQRGVTEVNREFNSAQELNNGNGAVWSGYQPNTTLPQARPQSISQTAEFPYRGGELFASTSQYPNENPERPNFDEYFDMDLAFLQMNFPGISNESLSDVYLANRCDLDAAVDMLQQLEMYPDDDSSDKLPDTLDIGDVSESGSVSELSPHKVKNVVTAEAGASKSGSSNMTSPS
ncbi:hypothetical protein ABFS82_05G129600 [Erythranthe guttata]|uniref:CUE domain-containing protein n=1 Tax=Erythranthe guttata TaxID=4155 RepID=A0A022QKL0_ERYGU|nr:PREDICTED: polyadenylate-binding protein-interacting protein 5 [Erythranthe guttata]EYU29257.1 hypothetical protein MIMGU_mgv1a014360mg [Erythranthe guttata]|eukprot:XP_012847319.1 PREDICTED: polyadenylate-binding protein-interacting protein 5 [Erythranthe guttata]